MIQAMNTCTCAHARASASGFTLIETLVAVSVLSVAIVAPMSLVERSLLSAYYARDQVTAFFLAQEAIEAVRHLRDHNILRIVEGDGSPQVFDGIPIGENFIVDTRTDDIWKTATLSCGTPPLKTDGTFYGYGTDPCNGNEAGWSPSLFTRTIFACYIQVGGDCTSNPSDEVRVTVTIQWQTGALVQRTFTISDNLYRWVQDGSAS